MQSDSDMLWEQLKSATAAWPVMHPGLTQSLFLLVGEILLAWILIAMVRELVRFLFVSAAGLCKHLLELSQSSSGPLRIFRGLPSSHCK